MATDTNAERAGAVNISAVAEAAGVSKTTVSHVLSGKRPVSARTQEHVERVMRDLGFTPNYFAQALTTNRSRSIALLVRDITNPYYPALARGLQRAAADADSMVMLYDAASAEASRFVEEVTRRRVDGVVLASSHSDDDIRRMRAAGIAVVAVGAELAGSAIDWVSADDRQIAADATRHLLDHGHRRVATISGVTSSEPGATRLAGWRQELVRAGLDPDTMPSASGGWTREGGYEAMTRLLSHEPPTAVFCANDLMAIGALDAVIQHGFRVPEDVAVVGVDDVDAASLVRPRLTTIKVPAEEIGRVAGELLRERIESDHQGPARQVLVEHELIVRESA